MTNTQSRIFSRCLSLSLAAAIAFGASSSSAQEFNENGYTENLSDEVLLAWEGVSRTARERFTDLMNGTAEYDWQDVAMMQEAFAEMYYAGAIDAMLAGDTASAQMAAELAQSYINSLDAEGFDTTRFDSMERDIYVLEELGVMNLEYLDFNATIEDGTLHAVSVSGQVVDFDAFDVGVILEIAMAESSGDKKPEYDEEQE